MLREDIEKLRDLTDRIYAGRETTDEEDLYALQLAIIDYLIERGNNNDTTRK
jgi:hypothetical protein